MIKRVLLIVLLASQIFAHRESDPRKDTICEYYMDENKGYTAKCPNLILTDDRQATRFTGEQMEKKTNEDVKYLEIVPPSSISFVPSWDIFTFYVNLENLDIRNVNVEKLEFIENCFPLVYITFSHNKIKELLADVFFLCRDLIRLDLSHNEIKEIHENTFSQPKNLVDVDLSFNRIEKISRKMLKPMKKLRVLNLQRNNIKSIPHNAINDLFDLTDLNLSENPISNIDVRFFEFVMFLESVNLAGTEIKKLAPGTFKSLKRLRYLDLSNNNFHALDGELLTSNNDLRELRINKCSLFELGEHFFDKVPHLSLVEAKGNQCVDGVFSGTLNAIRGNFETCVDNHKKKRRDPQASEL